MISSCFEAHQFSSGIFYFVYVFKYQRKASVGEGTCFELMVMGSKVVCT
jgi:hypothetical protein